MLLDPGMDLTLRPMRYPMFYDRFRDAIKNTWTVEEVDLHLDLADLTRLSPAERHLVSRLVAFFATGDTIVANNLVLNLYQHVNSPEGRLYLSRQLFEEAVHVQFYLNLLDAFVPDMAFAFDVVDVVRAEEPGLFDDELAAQVREMLAEAVDCEAQFAADLLGPGVAGLSMADMRGYLEHVADRRLAQPGPEPLYGAKNPLAFMNLQDVQELSTFFERRVSAYQMGVSGEVAFDADF